MQLSELLNAADTSADTLVGDAEITALAVDSRQVVPGACFVAIHGADTDGHRFIGQAVEAGAAAVICQDAGAVPSGTPHAVLPDTRGAIGVLAQAFFGWPARALQTVGITGTNGKTTVAYLLKHVLAAAGHQAALFGTITYQTGLRTLPAATTTPDPISLASMMAEAVADGASHLVMEVSSHALDQDRVGGIEFDVGVLTNVTSDHLDYHASHESYQAAKRKLFESLGPQATAVLNQDDAAGRTFAAATGAKVLWYGLSPAADVRGRIDRIDIAGTEFLLTVPEGDAAVSTPLIGRHNAYNCVAVAAAAEALGIGAETVAAALSAPNPVPGRLQRVDTDLPFAVFVDYAHTDDALANVLSALRPLTAQRLIVVFGCGGDRDRTKRPRMAGVAEQLADRIVITSDNPRSEDPGAIIDEIAAGLDKAGRAKSAIQPDRRSAIAMALDGADEGDVVLIAGKGHETYQVIGTERLAFDDAAVAAEILEARSTA
ncbi:MAG: UDP-N-acetylmuramoyl-L-alanyl-D-glutamate--2,6-diaminopimelate ligase [Planctomycetota bacterium]|jgi:UDP-N-acetylmuramoyl-L-alanyl-D-glutamate--2,6-diaminopimelate ligase